MLRDGRGSEEDWRRGYKRGQALTCGPFLFFIPEQDELAYPAHHVVLVTNSRNRGAELSGATMIPQMTVVADLTQKWRAGK